MLHNPNLPDNGKDGKHDIDALKGIVGEAAQRISFHLSLSGATPHGLHLWDIRATQVLIEEAGGKPITRPSTASGTVDSIFGSAPLVEQLAELMGF